MKPQSYSWPPKDNAAPKAPSRPAAANSTRTNHCGSAAANPWGSAEPTDISDPWANDSRPAKDPYANASIKQMQAATDRHEQAIQESQQRMLKMATSAQESGAATLDELHKQGEQLRHIHREQGKIDENLKTADTLLTSLESWRGAAKNWLFGKKTDSRPNSARGGKNKSEPPPPHSQPAASSSSHHKPGAAGGPQFTVHHGGAGGGGGAAMAQSDDPMERLAGLVDGLHAQALSMNDAIKDQSGLIDQTIESAESQQSKLDKNNRRARKLIGK